MLGCICRFHPRPNVDWFAQVSRDSRDFQDFRLGRQMRDRKNSADLLQSLSIHTSVLRSPRKRDEWCGKLAHAAAISMDIYR